MPENGEAQIAMVAITRNGTERLLELGSRMPAADLYISQKFADRLNTVTNRVQVIEVPLRVVIAELFERYNQLLCFFSVGAVVRLIAPCLRSKEVDPGVVVVDESGRFVIPILSGHQGGANRFAQTIAGLLDAIPVITTASDALGTLAVDILGRELGWKVEAPKINLLRVAAHVVNGEPIAFVQEAGSRAWWHESSPLPENIQLFDRFEDVDLNRSRAVLWVTRRNVDAAIWEKLAERLVVYRPPQDQAQ